MIESVAWGIGITGTSFAVASVVKSFYAERMRLKLEELKAKVKPHCEDHQPVEKLLKSWTEFSRLLIVNASNIVSIKQSVWDITLFLSEFVSGAMEDENIREKAKVLRDRIHERTYNMREKNVGFDNPPSKE